MLQDFWSSLRTTQARSSPPAAWLRWPLPSLPAQRLPPYLCSVSRRNHAPAPHHWLAYDSPPSRLPPTRAVLSPALGSRPRHVVGSSSPSKAIAMVFASFSPFRRGENARGDRARPLRLGCLHTNPQTWMRTMRWEGMSPSLGWLAAFAALACATAPTGVQGQEPDRDVTPKSSSTARAIAAGATGAPILVGAALGSPFPIIAGAIAGPSMGNVYADDWTRATRGAGWRLGIMAGTVVGAAIAARGGGGVRQHRSCRSGDGRGWSRARRPIRVRHLRDLGALGSGP